MFKNIFCGKANHVYVKIHLSDAQGEIINEKLMRFQDQNVSATPNGSDFCETFVIHYKENERIMMKKMPENCGFLLSSITKDIGDGFGFSTYNQQYVFNNFEGLLSYYKQGATSARGFQHSRTCYHIKMEVNQSGLPLQVEYKMNLKDKKKTLTVFSQWQTLRTNDSDFLSLLDDGRLNEPLTFSEIKEIRKKYFRTAIDDFLQNSFSTHTHAAAPQPSSPPPTSSSVKMKLSLDLFFFSGFE